MNDFLKLNDDYTDTDGSKFSIFDDVEIIVDPELEDEATVDINDYLNKHILQCRICGNLFPSDEIPDDDSECPICDSKSPQGFIYKGKLLNKNNKKSLSDETTDKTNNESKFQDNNSPNNIFTSNNFDEYMDNELDSEL